MNELLNEPQERALRSTFARLEELLEHCRQLRSRQEGATDNVFLRHEGNLTEQQNIQLEEQETRARDLLRQLHDTFALEEETVNTKHLLVSQCSLMGADLEEFLPNHWKGAGELNPQAKEILENAIPELIDTMQKMVDLLE